MIQDAIFSIPADDRDIWVTVGMAVKSEMGEEGFPLWDQWSRTSPKYKESEAKSVWRSIRRTGGITIRTLYMLARANGYTGEPYRPDPFAPRTDLNEYLENEHREDLIRRREAADRAADMLKRSTLKWHQYLVNKGFPKAQGFVLDGLLLVPMRNIKTNRITSVQTISSDGEKKFIKNGRAKDSVFVMGAGATTFLCEGYATGLSVKAAVQELYLPARVVVCFSASNLKNIAEAGVGQYVIADNDESRAGEKWAKATGLPYWMPPSEGDANDFHKAHGIRALANQINSLRVRGRMPPVREVAVPDGGMVATRSQGRLPAFTAP